jgi:hypothetical protein
MTVELLNIIKYPAPTLDIQGMLLFHFQFVLIQNTVNLTLYKIKFIIF